jgi:hypothetical protein
MHACRSAPNAAEWHNVFTAIHLLLLLLLPLSLPPLLLLLPPGRPFFKLSAALFSIGNKRQLLDAYGTPLLHIERKMLSLHGTWLLLRPSDGAKLAELKSSLMSLTPCEYC